MTDYLELWVVSTVAGSSASGCQSGGWFLHDLDFGPVGARRALRCRRRCGPRPAARPGHARIRRSPPAVAGHPQAPADAVVFQRAAHAVVGHGALLQADAAARAEAQGKERAQRGGAAVSMVRAERPAEVPIRREGAHHCFGVTGGQRRPVAADYVAGVGLPRLEDRRPDVAPLVDRPLAAVGAEHHRQVVGGLGDDRHRPRQFSTVVVQVSQQFHHGPPAGARGGHRLGTGVQPGQPGQVVADEPPHLLVPADLAGAGIVDHHLTRPHGLQDTGVTLVQCGEVLARPDRPGPQRESASAPAARHWRSLGTTACRPLALSPPDRFPAGCRF